MAPDDGLDVWGGIECTIARVGDTFRDQVGLTGHHHRPADLDLVAGLGIRTLRYPVLWEAVSGHTVPLRGWAWHDERMARLRDLGIRPIVGLLHHGSGPRDTSLLDPAFPTRFAAYAAEVARRYPWVDAYTPINEPLTTARFSALYGLWYPHRRSYPDVLRALVHQCRAVDLAMRAVDEVNPKAELVQTEDLGRVFASPSLAYQAEHENERRWLTFDLLFGRVGPAHPWWRIFLENGISAAELEAFEGARAPDILGINHYLTSDRYLDEDLTAYPEHLRGDNGRHPYADVEAVRTPGLQGLTGIGARLREVSLRYRAPVAVTEVHHGCTREEQLRWLAEVWRETGLARRDGVDVRAVTVWSLFGACDWNSLLTREDGIYEPGAYDVRGEAPRPTALARATASLARHGTLDHPVLAGAGWWHRWARFYRPGLRGPEPPPDAKPRLAVVGRPGPLRDECCRILDQRGLAADIVSQSESGRLPMSGLWAIVDLGEEPAPCGTADDASAARRADAIDAGIAYLLVRSADGLDAGAGDHDAGVLVVLAGTLFGGGLPLAIGGATCSPPRGAGLEMAVSYVPDLLHVALDLLIDGEVGTWRLVNVRSGAGGSPMMPPLESALARLAQATAASPDWPDMRLAAAE